jgi:hypothetical protein
VNGGAGNDTIIGSKLGQIIVGGPGHDTMTGGAQHDFFDFNAVGESLPGASHDIINSFQHNLDDIDLRTIDAKPGGTDNPFTWIIQQPFHHVKGELHYKDLGATCLVQGDVTGDGKADFEILVHAATLSKGDFLL